MINGVQDGLTFNRACKNTIDKILLQERVDAKDRNYGNNDRCHLCAFRRYPFVHLYLFIGGITYSNGDQQVSYKVLYGKKIWISYV